MTKEQYHHGDLRRSLIEKGLEMINQEGEEKLSLRKVAMKCGVSNAAPYAHFKSKDEFIVAIQQHIMDSFTDSLEKTADQYKDSDSLLPMLGKSYVMFFYKNPLYFDFLFSRKNIRIQLSLSVSDENENPPLDILKKTAVSIFKKANISEKSMQDKIIAMWALVQGLSSIVTMPNVEYDDDWEVRIEEIIKSIAICYK
ncbi:MAG: TetR/AcrR family transcriptional regulator [Clostridium sp.]|nr:TetR/AcrR family transcriptional regulator [Clostridium sp.]